MQIYYGAGFLQNHRKPENYKAQPRVSYLQSQHQKAGGLQPVGNQPGLQTCKASWGFVVKLCLNAESKNLANQNKTLERYAPSHTFCTVPCVTLKDKLTHLPDDSPGSQHGPTGCFAAMKQSCSCTPNSLLTHIS